MTDVNVAIDGLKGHSTHVQEVSDKVGRAREAADLADGVDGLAEAYGPFCKGMATSVRDGAETAKRALESTRNGIATIAKAVIRLANDIDARDSLNADDIGDIWDDEINWPPPGGKP